MTVSAQTPINRSTGNGVTTVFPYTFKIISSADMEVSVDGVVKTLTVDYTLSGVGDDAGGNVTMLAAPATSTSVVRRRNMALTRNTDYQDQGELPASTLDSDLDSAVLMIQQVDEKTDRAMVLPADVSGFSTELPTPIANYFLRVNSAGTALELASEITPGALTVTPFIETLLNDSMQADARTTLGAAASGANTDITSLTGLSNGGIPLAKVSGAAASGANSDITSLAAPALGGATATTQSTSDNSTKLATTAFVKSVSTGITLGTSVASTSGTSIDFTGIPSTAKRITIHLAGVSTNGTSLLMVQLGDSGGVETSGYLGGGATSSSGTTSTVTNSSGFILEAGGAWSAASIRYGVIFLALADSSSTWVLSSVTAATVGNVVAQAAGGKQVSPGPLDRVRITTVGGSDTFDAGAINISWE